MTTNNAIAQQQMDGLTIQKVLETPAFEILSITLAKGETFPTHTSPKDATLLVLSGEIDFCIQKETVHLKSHQTCQFEKMIEHHVIATEDSRFLIIR